MERKLIESINRNAIRKTIDRQRIRPFGKQSMPFMVDSGLTTWLLSRRSDRVRLDSDRSGKQVETFYMPPTAGASPTLSPSAKTVSALTTRLLTKAIATSSGRMLARFARS
jgi:hypothetical protein